MNDQTTTLDILKRAGLTESQAKGYLALVEHGALTPTELATKTGENRTNAYAITDKLVELGLARRNNSTKTTFEAENPTKIRSLLTTKQRQLKSVENALSGVLPNLLSQFRLTSDQPGVLNVEGVEALKLVYNEIIANHDDVLIFPSQYDRNDPEISKLIDTQIARQRKAGVKSLSFVRSEVYNDLKQYANDLLEIRPLPADVAFDAQIMIFGHTVVTTVFNHGIVSTIITSPEVAATLRSVFYALWDFCDVQRIDEIDS